MVERRPGVIPPSQGPGPVRRRPSPRQVAFRRAAILVVLAALAAVVGLLIVPALRGKHHAAAPATTAPLKPLRIVFPEGFTRRDMAERIDKVDGIAARDRQVRPLLSGPQYLAATASSLLPATFARDKKRRDLEGFLFPATYDFGPSTTSRQLVAEQLQAFRANWAHVNLAYARSRHLTPYDVLIIASMVEKEALSPDERSTIAAVIYNRLHRRMPLGIDATLRYGLHIPPTQSIRESQLRSSNPYNTRKLLGLPPTPIANPGLASMQAAAHPAQVNYLYFVRKPDKQHHYFTASYRDFVNYERAHGYK